METDEIYERSTFNSFHIVSILNSKMTFNGIPNKMMITTFLGKQFFSLSPPHGIGMRSAHAKVHTLAQVSYSINTAHCHINKNENVRFVFFGCSNNWLLVLLNGGRFEIRRGMM